MHGVLAAMLKRSNERTAPKGVPRRRPPWHHLGPVPLNLGSRQRPGAFDAVWPSATTSWLGRCSINGMPAATHPLQTLPELSLRRVPRALYAFAMCACALLLRPGKRARQAVLEPAT